MKLVFEPAARAEFLRAIRRYTAEAGAIIAGEFKNEVTAKLSALAENPALGSVVLRDIQRFPLGRFPFIMLFTALKPTPCA